MMERLDTVYIIVDSILTLLSAGSKPACALGCKLGGLTESATGLWL